MDARGAEGARGARGVVLDIGGVLELTPPTGWVERWEARLALAAGTVEERMRDVWEAGCVGRIGEAEVAAQIGARLGLGARDVEAFLGDLWAEYLGVPNEELIGYVRELRGRCRLVILSNSFVGARERECARYGFDELVEEIVYSHEIGVEKPDPRAFLAACAALGLEPADCLLVDDAGANVEGARAVGMRAHLFEDNARAVACVEGHLGAE